MQSLKEIGAIPVTCETLADVFPQVHALNQKLSTLETRGDLIRLKRGLYVVPSTVTQEPLSRELISNHLYGPSYLSQETALAYYGLIPERVHVLRAMTTKHTRVFETPLGRFEYTTTPKDYFPIGFTVIREKKYSFLIASPEKALCDCMVFRPNLNLRYRQEIIIFLQEDLRLDMEAFYAFRPELFRAVAACGKKSVMLNQVATLLERTRNE